MKNSGKITDYEERIAELMDENKLLFDQLHIVQEELEFCASKYAESGIIKEKSGSYKILNDDFFKIFADNIRLQVLIDTQREIHAWMSKNALSVRLGNLLIQGVDSAKPFLMLPVLLCKIWRESRRKDLPAEFGGEKCEKVIAAHRDGGFSEVERLLASVSISPNLQASALTILARSLQASSITGCVDAARRAFEIDPRPFRLKWLAFRTHDSGDAVRAEAMLDALLHEMHFSESEEKQVHILRRDANRIRLQEAKKQFGI